MKLSVFLLVYALNICAHPYQHSLAVFDYNVETQQMELSMKILTADFKAVTKKNKIQSYIQEYLILDINGQFPQAKYHGFENQREFTWLYLTFNIKIPQGVNLIEVTNSLFKSRHKNQFNTVKINLFKQTQVHNFSPKDSQHIFVFE